MKTLDYLGLDAQATKVTVKELQQLLADLHVFYMNMRGYHWYIEGKKFFVLHEKFEEFYDEVTKNLDKVAERLLAIGGQPYSTLSEFVEHSIIEEKVGDKHLTQDEMVKALVEDFNTIGKSIDEGILLTDEKNDFVTNDILIDIREGIDLHLWMLNAYLGEEATTN